MLPRNLHPGAWWLWALGMAVAASRTTNPLLLGLILAVTGLVVTSRRGTAPWALAFRMYVYAGALIVVMRVAFRIVFGGIGTGHLLFRLPEIPLPDWAAGIRLLGPVHAEDLLGGFYDGLRLATMLICLGAANALANPKRMLRAIPSALYEVGAAVVVALSVAPQLVESVGRVRRARRLRGGSLRGARALRGLLIPVLEDALDRSLMLAAAMDSRGYGRTGGLPRRTRALTGLLVISGLIGVCVGVYGLLDATAPRYLGAPVLAGGLALAAVGFTLGGRRVARSAYRPDRWRPAEFGVIASGIAATAALWLAVQVTPDDLHPSLFPLGWPALPVLPVVGMLLGALPAWLTPEAPHDRVR